MQPTDLDAVFGALADPTRRAILARLTAGERLPEFEEPGGEDRGLGKTGEIPEEAQLVGIEGIPQALQEQWTKQA